MQVESKIRNIKGRTSYLNQRPRRTKSTCASSPFDSAKVVRNTETAKRNLEKLAEKYKGINNVEGFLNDLWLALGLHNQGGNKKGGKPSRYALYQLQDGTKLSISIRASAHNANANKYVEHPPVPDINLSIVLQKKMRKNQFKSNPSVNIEEYVYVNQKIQNVESPLSQIANSLIGFLSNGEYNDTTGVAIVHGNMQTPQEVVNNQTLNCNRNMNKKLIRLTENDLHKIVKESVIRVLNEKLVYRNAKFYTPTPIPSNGGPMYNDTFAFKEFQKLIDGCNRQLKLPVLNRKQGIDASEFLIQQFENWVNEYGKYIVSNQPIGKLIKGSGIQNKFGEIEYVKGDGGYARIFADCVNSGTPYYDEAAETFDPYPDEEAYF